MPLRQAALAALLVLLAACSGRVEQTASTPSPPTRPVWAFEGSDIPVEPGYRFGRLPNGMRYVIRRNDHPKGTALVRMELAAGSLDEAEDELGFAHFVEHMAFNGSKQVPEGEMVRLLQREGLAFGADTNASTGFETTTYMLDLPRNDPRLLGTALMLMRETASELTIAADAVERERGVVLSEMRDRNTWQYRNSMAHARFLLPEARYPTRFPIGTAETLQAATAEKLRAFYQREYVPGHATLIVVGDFDPALVEAEIISRFSDWSAEPAVPQPSAGPVDASAPPRTAIYIDPALSERVIVARHGPWLGAPDSVAQRRENVLRQIGYGMVNRRFQRLSRLANPPFRGAGFGTAQVFRVGRTTNLIVDTVDGKWRRGLAAAAAEYRRALQHGFTPAEVAEQVAGLRTSSRHAAAAAATRPNGALMNAVFALIREDLVPSSPQSALERLEAYLPEITPERVLAAMKRDAVPLEDPLLRFQGRRQPAGGERGLRQAWNQAMRGRLDAGEAPQSAGFAYTDFGPEGTVQADTREPLLGIRTVRFANGVRLNLKRTELDKDKVLVQLSLDGGERINTQDDPLVTQMVPYLPVGGLGRHSQDALQSITAGHTVGSGVAVGSDSFVASAQTTPDDLALQLQLYAALVSDPGYRPEGEVQYRLSINNFFNQLRATPLAALQNAQGGILSDNDPRFTLQPVETYRKLTFDKLKKDLADPLGKGAIEIGIVGDIDEDATIALVARTFGALPPRAPEFDSRAGQPPRPFTQDRSRRVIRHTGAKDQALLRLTWPTRDDSDPLEATKLDLLEKVVRVELTETVRERLGKAYSPSAASSLSRAWPGYGVFGIAASISVSEVAATRAAIAETIARLRDMPVGPDELERARRPMIEGLDNALKSNGGWLSLVDRAQSEDDRIERYVKARERLLALTAADVQDMARRYLRANEAVEILVLPEGVAEPAS